MHANRHACSLSETFGYNTAKTILCTASTDALAPKQTCHFENSLQPDSGMHTAGRPLEKGTMMTVRTRMVHLKRWMTWGGCPCMPSAPPSSADSRNTPNAIAGSRNVVSATVKSVNQDVPPSMSEGICNWRQSCKATIALEIVCAQTLTADPKYVSKHIQSLGHMVSFCCLTPSHVEALCHVKQCCCS